MLTLSDKRILVTGGSGLLGKFLLKKLLARGVPAKNIYTPRQSECDLRVRENCVRAVKSTQIVFHLAAITGNLELHRDRPGSVFYDNFMMGVQLLEASRQEGVKKFVGIGTAAEYSESVQSPFREEDVWKGYPQPIHAPYALAKKMLLAQGLAYHAQYGFEAIHLLLTNIYGPGERVESGYVIPQLIKKIIDAQRRGQGFIEIWGSGNSRRDFLYAEDAAEAVVCAAERYDKPEPVNIGSGSDITIKDLAEKLCEAMNFRGEIRFDKTRPEGQQRRVLDVAKAERELGWRATTSLDTGLQRTIEWFNEVYKPNL